MKIAGNDQGVAELKALHAADKNHIKCLIDEARTNTDRSAEFRGKDGVLYVLRLDLKSGDLQVEPSHRQRESRLPPAR